MTGVLAEQVSFTPTLAAAAAAAALALVRLAVTEPTGDWRGTRLAARAGPRTGETGETGETGPSPGTPGRTGALSAGAAAVVPGVPEGLQAGMALAGR